MTNDCGDSEDAIRAGERRRMAAHIRSLSPIDFLSAYGLKPYGRCGPVLKALADEIEAPPQPGPTWQPRGSRP